MRICIRDEARLKDIRLQLLQSAWFSDVLAGDGRSIDQVAAAVYQPEGKTILPSLSPGSKQQDIKSVLKSINKKLGPVGRAAMRDYLGKCGVSVSGPVAAMLDEVFGPAARGVPAKRGASGHQE